MALTFADPVHANTGLIFAPQDYASGAVPFAGVGVRTAVRLRGRFPGVGIDNNGFLANDTDPNGDPLSYRLVSTVSNGVLEAYLGSAFTYTPTPGFVGVDSFVYQVYAGGTAGGTATVTITVSGAFAGVPVPSRLRFAARSAVLSFGVTQQGVLSRWRLRSASAAISYGANLQSLRSRQSLRSEPATLTIGGSANQIVNGDFAAPSIAPWILGPNTVASIVNGQGRLSAVAASQTPVYVYQEVLTVPGTTYVLDADVIPGAGFGATGITVANPLLISDGNLSYGGHINATYLVPGNSVFVVLHYAITDPSEFVYFDNVALTGLLGAIPANLTALRSAFKLVSVPATLVVITSASTGRTVFDFESVSELSPSYLGGGSLAAGLAGATLRIDCGFDLTDTSITAVHVLRPDGTSVTRAATLGTRRVRSGLGKTLRANHYVSFVAQAGDFAVRGRYFVRVTSTDGLGQTILLRRFLLDVEP